MKFEAYDPNATYKAKLSEGHEDCTIRALMIVTGKTWLQCYDILTAAGRELRAMPDTWDALDAVLHKAGFKYHQITDGAQAPTTAQFARDHGKGLYIIDMMWHVAPLKDGVLYDAENTGRRKVLGYWAASVQRAPAKKATKKKEEKKENTKKHIQYMIYIY